ncbi:MAG TPA: tetratricopeptide repeat protein, partial [Gammaproteobacteria bacterium]
IRALVIVCCGWAVAAAPAHGQEAAAAPASGPETAGPANWLEARVLIEELAESGDFAAAAALEARLLELAAAEFGDSSARLAETHLLIAGIRQRGGDYTAAETSILNAIEVYTDQEGPLSPALIDPFLVLGENYDAAGDFGNAMSAYSEARTIGRRNFGLLNPDQLDIIDSMTEAAERLGQLEEARNLQLEALTLVERSFEEASLEALDAKYKYAAWLRDHRQYDEERRIYFEILRVLDRDDQEDPLLTVRALRERARSYRNEDNSDGIGLSGLRDAVEMVEAMPEPPPLVLAELHLEIGDWNVEFSRTGVIDDDYLAAWNYLGSVTNGEELRREWFDGLTVVEIDPISSRGLSSNPEAPRGYVVIRFTVDRNGRTRDVEVTDSYPPGFKDGSFIRQYREARFRPRIVNGELVPVRRARRNEFRFDPVEAGISPE